MANSYFQRLKLAGSWTKYALALSALWVFSSTLHLVAQLYSPYATPGFAYIFAFALVFWVANLAYHAASVSQIAIPKKIEVARGR